MTTFDILDMRWNKQSSRCSFLSWYHEILCRQGRDLKVPHIKLPNELTQQNPIIIDQPLYITLNKAWGNVYVVGSGPYMWSGCKQRKRKRWLQNPILGLCQRRDCLDKEVRYAPDMVLKHSQKGDFLRSAAMRIPLLVECMLDHFRDTRIIYSTPDVPLIVQALFSRQWQSHLPTGHNATLAHSLSSSQ